MLRKEFFPAHLPRMPASLARAAGLLLRGRRRDRWRTRKLAWKWAEWLITFFGYYELNAPKSHLDYRLGEYGHAGEQLFMFGQLVASMLNFVRLRSGAISVVTGQGRGPANLVDVIRAFELEGEKKTHGHRAWEKLVATTTAKPLSVQEIERTTPLTSGTVKPEEHLLAGRAQELLDFRARALEPPPPSTTIPNPKRLLFGESPGRTSSAKFLAGKEYGGVDP